MQLIFGTACDCSVLVKKDSSSCMEIGQDPPEGQFLSPQTCNFGMRCCLCNRRQLLEYHRCQGYHTSTDSSHRIHHRVDTFGDISLTRGGRAINSRVRSPLPVLVGEPFHNHCCIVDPSSSRGCPAVLCSGSVLGLSASLALVNCQLLCGMKL